MLALDALSPDDEQLLPLVIAIADGTPVDWSGAPPRLLQRLQHLERVVRAHEAVRCSASADRISASRETLLTEARRAGVLAEQPLRVQWGPLIVHEKIGRGSFGDVYRAWDPRLARDVALKLIPEDISAPSASPVVEEGRLLARVRHPNVMIVYGAERVDGRVGIWTEYIRGETLASEVGRRGPLPAGEAAQIAADVCAALGAVHAAGLLHRDVKAQNILRDATGRIALGDFGTGIELAHDASVSDPQIAGTPLYLAPEVLEGAPATIASDLYGAGVLLYFLLTGAYPVRGRTLAEIKFAHATERRTSLRATRPDLPDPLIPIIETLLAVEPDKRYATAAAAEAALRGWLARPPAPRSPRRRPAVTAVVMGALVVVALGAGVAWRYGWHPPRITARQSAARLDAAAARAALTLKAGDWIFVTEFDNDTGDASLDGVMRAAVERELEFSDYVRVVQRDRIEDALKLLQRPLDSRLDRDLVLELSQHDGGIRAFISGAIARADDGYALTFELVNPADRTATATLTDHASGQAAILPAVRRQMLRIREAFGEPAASIERSDETLQRAALPSLKALKLAAQARGAIDLRRPRSLSDWVEIEKIAREVIEEDSAFPVGHGVLAWAMTQQGRREDGLRAIEHAVRLSDNATPQERHFVIGTLHKFKGLGPDFPLSVGDRQELDKAAAAYEAVLTLQPDHYFVRDLLVTLYQTLGRERDVAWMKLRLADARPRSVRVNFDVAIQLLREANVDGARRYGARAESSLSAGSSAAEPDLAASVRLFRAFIAWSQDNANEALRVLDRAAPSAQALPADERRQLYRRLWRMYAALGRLQQAEHVLEMIRTADRNDFPNSLWADMARAELLEDRGEPNRLREFAAAHLCDPLPATAPPFLARRLTHLIEGGLLDAAASDLKWFEQRTAEAARSAPFAQATQFEPFYTSSAGALELARGRPAAAVALLGEAMPAIRQGPPQMFSPGGYHGQYAAVKLAAALEATGNVSEAIKILEDAVRDRVSVMIGNSPNRWIRTKAQLARLYRRNGQPARAREVEAHLLKILAAADADHPLVLELRQRR